MFFVWHNVIAAFNIRPAHLVIVLLLSLSLSSAAVRGLSASIFGRNFEGASAEDGSGPLLICHGDCDSDGEVSIDEVIQLVAGALGNSSLICPGVVPSITTIIQAVNSDLRGCVSYTYRLTEGSRILSVSADGFEVVEEPLAGGFILVQSDPVDGVGSSRFVFSSIELESPSFAISRAGPSDVRAVGITLEGLIGARMNVSINTNELVLQGQATFAVISCDSGPPCDPASTQFSALQVCGKASDSLPCSFCTICPDIQNHTVSGYGLTIYAVPD